MTAETETVPVTIDIHGAAGSGPAGRVQAPLSLPRGSVLIAQSGDPVGGSTWGADTAIYLAKPGRENLLAGACSGNGVIDGEVAVADARFLCGEAVISTVSDLAADHVGGGTITVAGRSHSLPRPGEDLVLAVE